MAIEGRVFIAGAGPVGLVAAANLTRRGVPVTVFEAGAVLAEESRASTFHPPTLDMLDEFGAAAPLMAQGLVAPQFQYRTRDGVIAIETPNPECLAIFATHFYLDPTHTRPVPHPLLVFYLEEFGIGRIEVRKLSPAVESMPALASLPEEFRAAFFGGLDYAVIGRKL